MLQGLVARDPDFLACAHKPHRLTDRAGWLGPQRNGGFEEIKGAYSSWEMINPPVVCEDGFIWALKMGTNRLIALKHLCYTSVDAIYFEHPNDLIKTGIYLREEDPLHNE